MSEPFIAEIKIFAGNFAPRGWAFCNGQLLQIAQNSALFALIGTTYGGDGRTTTALPDLQGRAPMHPGGGPGLSALRLGQKGGAETVALTAAQLPSHSHTGGLPCSSRPGNSKSPVDHIPAVEAAEVTATYTDAAEDAQMGAQALSTIGGGQQHGNVQPYLAINYIIALLGIFPA